MTTQGSPFGDEPFSVAAGLAAGVGRGALAGARFDAPFRGVRQWKGADPGDPAEPDKLTPKQRELRDFKKRCRQFATRMGDTDFFSHGTALILRGVPTPLNWDEAIHVSGLRPRNPARSAGVVSHRLAHREAAFRVIGGLRVEHPVRAWVQASTHLTEVELIVAADHLVARRRGLATIDQLRAEARRNRAPALEPVLDRVRDGSESPWETRLRLILVEAGLPEPDLAVELRAADGRFLARLDQGYRRYRVGVEYDGRQHAENPTQFARDADRWRDIADEGWDLVRILHHHLDPDPNVAIDLVRRALLRAGWQG